MGILNSTDHKTPSLIKDITSILWHFVLKFKAITTLGSEQKIRVGQVTGNTHFFFALSLDSLGLLQTLLNCLCVKIVVEDTVLTLLCFLITG